MQSQVGVVVVAVAVAGGGVEDTDSVGIILSEQEI